ncbi:hypothetical protein T439DRAFT_360607 [Meredithblackwellia eburnea MCA 4105]
MPSPSLAFITRKSCTCLASSSARQQRQLSSSASAASNPAPAPLPTSKQPSNRHNEREIQRDFILSVLEAHPSARDSRFYLKNFGKQRQQQFNPSYPPIASTSSSPSTSAQPIQHLQPANNSDAPETPAFPLSDSSTPTTAFIPTTPSPVSTPESTSTGKTPLAESLIDPSVSHTALVKIQGPFTDRQLDSIAEGMVYLKKLGLVSIIVLDNEEWEVRLREILTSEHKRVPLEGESLVEQRKRKREKREEIAKLRELMKVETMRFTQMLEAKGGSARPLLEGVLCVKGAEFRNTFAPIASISSSTSKRGFPFSSPFTSPSTTTIVESAELNEQEWDEASDEDPYSSSPTPPRDLFVDSLSGIRDAIRRDEIPIIPPVALDNSCFSLCVSANDAVRAISSGLADHERRAGLRYESDTRLPREDDVDLTPVRIMVINSEGGIPSPARGGNPHLSINLEAEFEHINSTFTEEWKVSHPTSLANLELVRSCLVDLPRTASAVIVSHRSPRSLIANLITNKPAHSPSLHHSLLPVENLAHQPTIIRRGLPIRVFRHLGDIDKSKMTELLEQSFGRELMSDDYFERLERSLEFCIVAGDYQGCAIVTNEVELPSPSVPPRPPIAYLDKFAVLPSLQGDGTVDFLWGALRDESFGLGLPSALNPNVGGLQGKGQGRDLVWRSRSNNPVNKWYFERSNGFFRIPPPKGSKVGFSLFWCEREDRKPLPEGEHGGTSTADRLESPLSAETMFEATNAPSLTIIP